MFDNRQSEYNILYECMLDSYSKFVEECKQREQREKEEGKENGILMLYMNPIYIMKTTNILGKNCYVVCLEEDENIQEKMALKPSKVSFLSIEYKHPEMEYTIDFALKKEWMITGNILFTPSFVLRMLEYQSKSFYFDSTYKIRIVDGTININEFGVDGCIRLNENDYVIQTIENIDNEMYKSINNLCGLCDLSEDDCYYEGDIDTNSSEENGTKEEYICVEGKIAE